MNENGLLLKHRYCVSRSHIKTKI